MAVSNKYQNGTQYGMVMCRRPPGILIIGYLTLFAGISRLFSPFERPFLAFGSIYHGFPAVFLRISITLLGIYVGVGILKCFRHIWFLYLIVTCADIMNLGLNIMHESKMWELSLLLHLNMTAIPRFVRLTHDMQYMLIVIYVFAAWYVYAHKEVFLGNTEL